MLVKMHHETTGKTADVHPDEVANYRAGGYVVAEQPQAEKPKRGRPAKKAAA